MARDKKTPQDTVTQRYDEIMKTGGLGNKKNTFDYSYEEFFSPRKKYEIQHKELSEHPDYMKEAYELLSEKGYFLSSVDDTNIKTVVKFVKHHEYESLNPSVVYKKPEAITLTFSEVLGKTVTIEKTVEMGDTEKFEGVKINGLNMPYPIYRQTVLEMVKRYIK